MRMDKLHIGSRVRVKKSFWYSGRQHEAAWKHSLNVSPDVTLEVVELITHIAKVARPDRLPIAFGWWNVMDVSWEMGKEQVVYPIHLVWLLPAPPCGRREEETW